MPTLRRTTDQRGGFVLMGNTFGFDCRAGIPAPTVGTIGPCGTNTADTAIDVFWRSDSPAVGQAQADNTITPAQARSSAVLSLPAGAQVTYARLYWSGTINGGMPDGTVTLDRVGTGAFTATVTADPVRGITTATRGALTYYQGNADITSLVRANGTGVYRVSGVDNMDIRNANEEVLFSNWNIVVFYYLASMAPHNLSLFDGLDLEDGTAPLNATINGFLVPNAGFDASLLVVSYEGDSSITGDALQFNGMTLSNGLNPANNFFNETRSVQPTGGMAVAVSNVGDLPQLSGQPGSSTFDHDEVDITPNVAAGNTMATFRASSTGDVYFLGAMGTSISTLKPVFTNTFKTVTNLTRTTGFVPGDTLQYTITTINDGNDTGINIVLNDVLPNTVTYVPGSLNITAGANMGAKTDATGDDQAEYIAANRQVRVRLGTGANGTTGGSMAVGETATITFRVTINAGVTGAVSNQAVITAAGQRATMQGVTGTVDFPSGNGPTALQQPTVVTVEQCTQNTDCPSANPTCVGTAGARTCGRCTMDSQCAGTPATPACNTTSGACVQCTATNATACVTPTAVCNVAANTCVQCNTNANCSGGTPVCVVATHVCRACAVATQATDCASPTAACNSASGACVAPAVAVSTPANGSTQGNTPTITGTATPGQTVTVTVDGMSIGTVVANAMGTWSLPWPTGRTPLTNGTHMAGATVPNGAGTVTATPTSFTVGCSTNADCSGATPICNVATRVCRACAVATQATDCTAPNAACNTASGACVMPAVVLTAPAAGSQQPGTPTITGTATPGQTVTVIVDGMTIGTAVANAMGAWSLPWPTGRTPLANGTHMASATVPNGSGTLSAGPNSFTVGCRTNADCSGSTPLCNMTTRVCVQCLASSDCSGGTPVCNTTSNTCRACAVATQATDCTTAPNTACNGSTGACVTPVVAVVSPATGSSASSTPTLTGTATPGQTVTVTVDGMTVGTTTADAMGNWSLPWPTGRTPLTNGTHMAGATVPNGAGTVSASPNTFTVGCRNNADCSGGTPICDTTSRSCRACMPAGPMSSDCSAPTTFCSSTGATSGQCVLAPPRILSPADGSSTAMPRPPIRGTGPANATVQVFIDGMAAGTAMTDASGNFTFTPTTSLSSGMHSVSAANVSGGVTGPQGASNSFTVTGCTTNADCSGTAPVCDTASRTCRPCNPGTAMDCVAPRDTCVTTGPNAGSCVATVPVITSPTDGSSTASRRPDIRGVGAPNSTVAVLIDGMEVGRAMTDGSGNFTFTPTMDLSMGMHTVAGAPVSTPDAGADGGTTGTAGPSVRFTITACTTSMNCSGGTPVCETGTGTCRPCAPATEMTDCPDPMAPVCATSGPNAGRCVARAPRVVTPADGSMTANRRPPLTGTGTPGAMIVVRVDGAEVGRVTVDASGNWTLTPMTDLMPGMHNVDAANVNPDGSFGTPGNTNGFTVSECAMDTDCSAGNRCDTTVGRCVPRTADAGMEAGSDAAMEAGRDGAIDARNADGSAEGGAQGRLSGAGACACSAPGAPSPLGGNALGAAALLAGLALASRRRRERNQA